MTLLAWCVAWILDVLIGDPPHWPHPVRWIGRLITVSQRVVRRVCHSDRALRIGGGVMWLVVTGLTWGVAWGALALAHGLHPCVLCGGRKFIDFLLQSLNCAVDGFQ